MKQLCADVAALAAAGMSNPEIAAAIGITNRRVWEILHEQDNRRRVAEARSKAPAAMLQRAGLTRERVATLTGGAL